MGCAGCSQAGTKKPHEENIIKRVHTSSIKKIVHKTGALDNRNVQKILKAAINGDLKMIKSLVDKFEIKEIVAIRGLQIAKEENFELSLHNTQMWNPLHFAVFKGHYDVVTYFIQELSVNPILTLMKPLADSDLDEDIMGEQFKEDKIFSIILAYERKHLEVLNFLLNFLHTSMPKNAIKYLVSIFRNRDGKAEQTKWDMAIAVILQSRSAHAFFASLSVSDRKEFVFNTLNDINDDRLYAIFEDEFSRQPYSSILQFYLIFECKTANSEVLQRAMKASTDQEIRAYVQNDEQLLNEEIDYQFIFQIKEQIVEDKVENLIDELLEKVVTLRDDIQMDFVSTNEDFLIAIANKELDVVRELSKKSIDEKKAFDLINIRVNQEFIDKYPEIVSEIKITIDDEEYEGNPLDWTPLHFAIFNSDKEMLSFLLQQYSIVLKNSSLVIPGFELPQSTKEILPLILAIQNDKIELFKYFWITLGHLWNDTHVEAIMKYLSQYSLEDYMRLILYTRTSISVFESLPFRYRFKYIENLVLNHEDVRDQQLQDVRQRVPAEALDQNQDWNQIWDFDDAIINAFSQRPYAFYYFVFLTEYEVPANWNEDDLSRLYHNMQQSYGNITEDDYFLYSRYHSGGAKAVISSAESLRQPENMKEQLGKKFGMNLKKYFKREMKGDLILESTAEDGPPLNERQRAYLDQNV